MFDRCVSGRGAGGGGQEFHPIPVVDGLSFTLFPLFFISAHSADVNRDMESALTRCGGLRPRTTPEHVVHTKLELERVTAG